MCTAGASSARRRAAGSRGASLEPARQGRVDGDLAAGHPRPDRVGAGRGERREAPEPAGVGGGDRQRAAVGGQRRERHRQRRAHPAASARPAGAPTSGIGPAAGHQQVGGEQRRPGDGRGPRPRSRAGRRPDLAATGLARGTRRGSADRVVARWGGGGRCRPSTRPAPGRGRPTATQPRTLRPAPRTPRSPDLAPTPPRQVTRGTQDTRRRGPAQVPREVPAAVGTHPRPRSATNPRHATDTRRLPSAPSASGAPRRRWLAGGPRRAARRCRRGGRLGGARRAADRGHLAVAGGRQPGRRRHPAPAQGVRDRARSGRTTSPC